MGNERLQRELPLEVKLAEFNTQMNALSAATRGDKPKPDVFMTDIKVVRERTTGPPLTIKRSPETVTKAPTPPTVFKKPAIVQVCAHSTSSATLLPSQASVLTRTQIRGVDPITLDYSTLDLTDTKATVGSHASSVEDNNIATNRVPMIGNGRPNLALVALVKTRLMWDLSVQATKGSMCNSPACSQDGGAIPPEQLRFTTVISKAMSKELAPAGYW